MQPGNRAGQLDPVVMGRLDELKLVARGFDRFIGLVEFGSEALAWRAPVRAKVQGQVLPADCRRTRQLRALAVYHHLSARRATWAPERGDAAHFEALAELRLELPLGKRL